jgi:hypothetical protein
MKYKFLSTKTAPYKNIVDMTTRQGSGGWWLHTDYPFTWMRREMAIRSCRSMISSVPIVYAIIPNKL